jgi:ubiquinone/menaquinone biosynthesis C-methylase UbiE
MMTLSVYDTIGQGYHRHRKPDLRITQSLVDLLAVPRGSVIADIGAGTGNYSCALADFGFQIKAVEPSNVMRQQAKWHEKVEWVTGTAEAIPLSDASVDAVVCIFASHHFSSLPKAASEMCRICPQGPIVWFTFDPRNADEPWIADYFPSIWSDAYRVFPPMDDLVSLIQKCLDRKIEVAEFHLPGDLEDFFLAACWRKPEMYLLQEVRNCMSGFALADQGDISIGLARLEEDLAKGHWSAKYGHILIQNTVDWGYRFIIARRRPRNSHS